MGARARPEAGREPSLRLRLILAAAVSLAVALGTVGVLLSALFADHTRDALEARLRADADALTAALEWGADGRLTMLRHVADPRFDAPYSGRYWQAGAADGPPLASRSLWDTLLYPPAAIAAATTSPGTRGDRIIELLGPQHQPLLVLVRTITLAERSTPVTLLVSTTRTEWTDATARFDRLLALALAITGAALLVASLAQIAYGLRPLGRLRDAVAELGTGRPRRLEGPWPAEVAPLVDELEALLARDATMLERARRQADDLAHSIRTPLAVLVNEVSAHGEEPFAHAVAQQASTIARRLERQLARARAAGRAPRQGGSGVDVIPVAESLMRAMRTLHHERALALHCEGAGRFAGDTNDLAEVLGNLLDNACKWAATGVRIAVRTEGPRLVVRIDDDGPGLPEGRSSPQPSGPVPIDESRHGSGLGLAIVEDIVTLYGGSVSYGRSPEQGLRVTLVLPVGTPGPAA